MPTGFGNTYVFSYLDSQVGYVLCARVHSCTAHVFCMPGDMCSALFPAPLPHANHMLCMLGVAYRFISLYMLLATSIVFCRLLLCACVHSCKAHVFCMLGDMCNTLISAHLPLVDHVSCMPGGTYGYFVHVF